MLSLHHHRRRAARCIIGPLATLCLLLGLSPLAHAVDDVSKDVLRAFNRAAAEADTVAAKDPRQAVEIYERALLSGPARGFGRLHLRIGQIEEQLGESVLAADHFRRCMEDERVDGIDREFVCKKGFERVTAPLTVTGLPPGAVVKIIEPALFAGDHRDGARLPRGEAMLVVEADGRFPRQVVVPIDGPTVWEAELGLPKGELVPEGFVDAAVDPVEPAHVGPPRWPAYAMAGLGLVLVGTGVGLGLDNRDSLSRIRDRQSAGGCGADRCRGDLDSAETSAIIADGMWMTGVGLAGGALAWWLLTDAAPPPLDPSQAGARR